MLSVHAKLCFPPEVIAAAEVLPENLPEAWKDGGASGLSIATALSMKAGKTLPWKTVRDVISSALQARFLVLTEDSKAWPCDFPSAQFVIFRLPKTPPPQPPPPPKGIFYAETDLEPGQIQDLGDIVPKFLEIKNKTNTPIRFHVRIEMGDGKTLPSEEAAREANALLKSIRKDLELKR